jgi:hypothetical protein
MTFKYAKSPKEKFTELRMNEIAYIGTDDPERTKPIKIKNQSNNMHDLKYLIYVNSSRRKFVFSANARSDLIMWMQGFNAYQ